MNDVSPAKEGSFVNHAQDSNDEAFITLQKNYNDLLSEHARALIAVDQLRVAKYLARPRAFKDKGMVTGMETQTENPDCLPVDLDAAVAELEAQIEECVPLFTGNSDPVGDLQGLLQGLQSDLAECLRNSDEMNCDLKNRISNCEEKIRNMEGALSLKLLDQNSSRNNSRANSRCSSRPRSAARGTSLCHTSSLISGVDMSTTNSYNYRDMSSQFENGRCVSDLGIEEELNGEESLTDIIDMHHDMRAESEVVTDNEGPSVSEQYHGAARRSDSYRRSCSDLDSASVSMSKCGQKHTSDSALGSSVNVYRQTYSKGIQEHPVATPRSTQGSSHSMKSGGGGGSVQGASVSNLSVASSRQMMYCTPLVGSENASRASTPANGYDFKPGPGSYQNNSECESEVQEILARGTTSNRQSRSFNLDISGARSTEEGLVKEPVEDISRRPPIRAKRSRVVKKERAATGSGGYDSGYNEDGSRKSSPPRPSVLNSSNRSTQNIRSEISVVRDDVQELADRLRTLRSDMNTSSRSSSPLPAHTPRSQLTRDALRDRLRRLQCSSPGCYEVGSRRSASPETADPRFRCSSPVLNRSSSPRLQRSSSPRVNRRTSPTRVTRSSSPTRHNAPRSPILGYSRSPRATRSEHSSSRENVNYRDSRHLFYDRGPEVGIGHPGKPPIEVGVRVGGTAAASFDLGPPTHSSRPRTPVYPIEQANFHVSPTSGMETHFHFNFFGQGSSGEYSPR